LQQIGRVQVLLSSTVKHIDASEVAIEHNGLVHAYRNDAVIVCAGGLLPTPLLQEIGIEFSTKYGAA
jgi:NADH dehydrogenase FAD-containing subunit